MGDDRCGSGASIVRRCRAQPGVAHVPNQVAKGQDPRFRACCASNETEAAGRRLGQQHHRHAPRRLPAVHVHAAHYHVAHVCEPVVPPCLFGGRMKIDACNIRRGRVVPDALRPASSPAARRAAQGAAQKRAAAHQHEPSPPPPPWYTVAKEDKRARLPRMSRKKRSKSAKPRRRAVRLAWPHFLSGKSAWRSPGRDGGLAAAEATGTATRVGQGGAQRRPHCVVLEARG